MYSNLKISEAKKLLKDELDQQILELDAADQVKTEYPISVEEYKLNHPRGALLVVYKGSDYKGSNNDASKLESFILQDRDIHIGVICIIRKNASGGMDVDDYVDFVKESLTGLVTAADRADNKTYPIADEWMKEDGGEWWYGITILVPGLNVEQEILDNQS